jgi:hypothetical protein
MLNFDSITNDRFRARGWVGHAIRRVEAEQPTPTSV